MRSVRFTWALCAVFCLMLIAPVVAAPPDWTVINEAGTTFEAALTNAQHPQPFGFHTISKGAKASWFGFIGSMLIVHSTWCGADGKRVGPTKEGMTITIRAGCAIDVR
jgi:hypothetical protein